MQKGHRAAANGKSKEKLGDGRANRGLARFVRSEDEVEVISGLRKRHLGISEFAVADELEVLKSHASFPLGQVGQQAWRNFVDQVFQVSEPDLLQQG